MIRHLMFTLAAYLALAVFPAQGPAQQGAPTPAEALQRLKAGNARFAADMLKEAKPPSRQRQATADKQKPEGLAWR